MVADDQWPADDTWIGEKLATCDHRIDVAADWALLRPTLGAEQRRGVRLVQCSPVAESSALAPEFADARSGLVDEIPDFVQPSLGDHGYAVRTRPVELDSR